MITINLSLSANGERADLRDQYLSKEDLIDAVKAHVAYALDRLDFTDITFTVVEVEGH
jgi:hypothetical protein